MTVHDFKSQVTSILKDKVDEDYLTRIDDDMERTFEEHKKLSGILGYDTPSPEGYAMGILMLYPDLP